MLSVSSHLLYQRTIARSIYFQFTPGCESSGTPFPTVITTAEFSITAVESLERRGHLPDHFLPTVGLKLFQFDFSNNLIECRFLHPGYPIENLSPGAGPEYKL